MKLNYIQHQIRKNIEIQPIIHNRNYSTNKNINHSELNDKKYSEALDSFASLRTSIDAMFDSVSDNSDWGER